jgi:hypothetical protein
VRFSYTTGGELLTHGLRLGEIVYVEAFGQPIVILGSLQAADEVFDKHGAVASDRPKSIMLKLYAPSLFYSRRSRSIWVSPAGAA